jgi:hypothetical protein
MKWNQIAIGILMTIIIAITSMEMTRKQTTNRLTKLRER